MIQRLSIWYLWLLPVSFLILAKLYQSSGLKALIVVGIFYLAAVAFAVSRILPATSNTSRTPSTLVAGVILIGGGAVIGFAAVRVHLISRRLLFYFLIAEGFSQDTSLFWLDL